MTPDMTIKTTCPSCGKKKGLTNLVKFLKNGGVFIKTKGKGCYKCGYCPEDG